MEVLFRDKHYKALGLARKVLEMLEQSRRLAQTHLTVEREFRSNLK
jgi:hypothetical protein